MPSYQTGETIQQTLKDIGHNKLVLPAIQREFVWTMEQIACLFDSIMLGYPFGTFLYWRVESANSCNYKFYAFACNYNERHPHPQELPVFHGQECTAVLDGQQRLTALNIGLSGSMALKIPNKRRNNPDAYPVRRLYLDLLAQGAKNDESGERYWFEFLTDEQAACDDPKKCWFKVGEILAMQDPGLPITDWLDQKRLSRDDWRNAHRRLNRLYQAIRVETPMAFYEEKSQELDKVLRIFVRTNRGGTHLSYSDLLLSTAVAQWAEKDATKEIHDLLDQLNGTQDGFNFSQDFVLKTGLMLTELGVAFKLVNFTRENMKKLEDNWPAVKKALCVTVQLIASFGFNEKTLRADSALLPIAYYVCRRGLDEGYVTRDRYSSDRASIHSWLIRSLLKASGIWGSGLDSLLAALRDIIAGRGTEVSPEAFPAEKLEELMSHRGKSLKFNDEEIDDLVEMEYGDKRVFAMLAFLFPFVDVRNKFEIDHVFPQALFTKRKLVDVGIHEGEVEGFQNMANLLPNLQLLEGNQSKGAQMPLDWLKKKFPLVPEERTNYCAKHLLGEVPELMGGFRAFYEKRRESLRARIAELVAKKSDAG